MKNTKILIPALVLWLLTFLTSPAFSADKYQYEYFEGQLGYFKELTLGHYANNNDKRVMKWVNDINIFVKGHMPYSLSSELDEIIADLNPLVAPIQLKKVSLEKQANYVIFIGSPKAYLDFEPSASRKNVNYGAALSVHENSGYEIVNGSMYLDPDIFHDDFKMMSVFRKLITHSLGTRYRSPNYEYADSIFSGTRYREIIVQYSNMDKTIISKLYSECVKASMDKFELDHALINGCWPWRKSQATSTKNTRLLPAIEV